jgi:aspartate aminotransferase-like enzyme
VKSWAEARGLPVYAPQGYRSQTVTTLRNTLNREVADINKFLLSRGMRLANGYGALKGVTFRIAHMGETSMAQIEELLAALDEFLA